MINIFYTLLLPLLRWESLILTCSFYKKLKVCLFLNSCLGVITPIIIHVILFIAWFSINHSFFYCLKLTFTLTRKILKSKKEIVFLPYCNLVIWWKLFFVVSFCGWVYKWFKHKKMCRRYMLYLNKQLLSGLLSSPLWKSPYWFAGRSEKEPSMPKDIVLL